MYECLPVSVGLFMCFVCVCVRCDVTQCPVFFPGMWLGCQTLFLAQGFLYPPMILFQFENIIMWCSHGAWSGFPGLHFIQPLLVGYTRVQGLVGESWWWRSTRDIVSAVTTKRAVGVRERPSQEESPPLPYTCDKDEFLPTFLRVYLSNIFFTSSSIFNTLFFCV